MRARSGWLRILVLATMLIGGRVSASTPDATGGESLRGDLVYDTCMEVNAGKVGASMLPIVCQVIAQDCKQDTGGEGCKKALHPLDEGLKAKGSSMLFAAAY